MMRAVRGGGICGSRAKRQRFIMSPIRLSASRIRTRRSDREMGMQAYQEEVMAARRSAANETTTTTTTTERSSQAPTPCTVEGRQEEKDDTTRDDSFTCSSSSSSSSTWRPMTSSSFASTNPSSSSCAVSDEIVDSDDDSDNDEDEEEEEDDDNNTCGSGGADRFECVFGPAAVSGAGDLSMMTTTATRPDKNTVGLVLGMIRMTDEFMDGYVGRADPWIDLHAARDTRRIWCLEDELQLDVIALGDSRTLLGVDLVQGPGQGKHVSGLFENPKLRDILNALNGRKIAYIFGDYIRFPPQYLRRAYRAVIKHLLPCLQQAALFAPGCQIYLPYLKRNDGVENVYEELESNKNLCPRLVKEGENPLYAATRTLFQEEHMGKTEGLMPGTPFLRLTTL